MTKLIRLHVVIIALSAQLWADAKEKLCFTPQEETAEMMVRGGLRLREGALGCDGRPWEMHTKPLWDQVDKKFGYQFRQQTNIRRAAFTREFSTDVENREALWDGRTVLYYRNYPLSQLYCKEIKTSLDTMLKSGWTAFAKQAAKA
jgi:hypothetical protein